MSQLDRAIFLYGFDITGANRYINFKAASLGPTLTASLNVGNYTATELMNELKRAMESVDTVNKYTWTIDRTVLSNTSNRVRVVTNGSYLSVLFGSGVNSGNTPAGLLGFANSDLTGSTSYVGISVAGKILMPEFPTFDYVGPETFITNDGSKNVSAYGIKETLVFAQMRFIQGQWQYISNQYGRTQYTEWNSFLSYATRQLKFEFSPSIFEDPNIFYQVTLEKTPGDGNGMGFKLSQMRGVGLYRFWDTGVMTFRVVPV